MVPLTLSSLDRFRISDRKNLLAAEREAIVTLSGAALSQSAIARQVGCSRAIVLRWLDRLTETENVKRKEGSREPHVTTYLEDVHMVNFVRATPTTMSMEKFGIFKKNYNMGLKFIFLQIFPKTRYKGKLQLALKQLAAALRLSIFPQEELLGSFPKLSKTCRSSIGVCRAIC